MSQENKMLVSRGIEEVWNQGHFDVADELLASDFAGHSSMAELRGPEEDKQFFASLRGGISRHPLHDRGPDRRRGQGRYPVACPRDAYGRFSGHSADRQAGRHYGNHNRSPRQRKNCGRSDQSRRAGSVAAAWYHSSSNRQTGLVRQRGSSFQGNYSWLERTIQSQ